MSRKPWPMKWIILLMILFIVPYTYINLHYRKPGPAFQPYQDARERMRAGRVGYKRVTLNVSRPTDLAVRSEENIAFPATGGLPPDLRAALLTVPLLPAQIGAVTAAPSIQLESAYRIQFACTLGDISQQLAGAQLYIHDSDIFILAEFERLSGGLLARSRQNAIVLSVPSGSFTPGTYRVVLVGETASKAWTLQVH